LPSRFQISQGELEMLPYVVSTDATTEGGYEGTALGHPLLRQALIFSQVGRDHLRPGTALSARRESLVKHILFTYHQGMPVFDLQLLQTHEGGLDRLESVLGQRVRASSLEARRDLRLVRLILRDPLEYYGRFLGSDGWIERARRLDYPGPEAEQAAFPAEYFSLVGFINHCASAFPSAPSDVPLRRMPAHLLHVVGRRSREGKSLGWFSTHRDLRARGS